jgi:hypothetical protein
MSIAGMPTGMGSSGPSPAGAGAAAGGGGSQVTYRVPPGSEAPLCYLVNTGEYCAEVVPQLEGLIRQKMAAALADQVDLSAQADLFLDLVAHALKILVAGVLDRLEASFRAMAGSNWAGSNMVGEESPYVAQFSAVLVDAMTRIREALSSSYLTNFCSRLASEVLQRFLDVVMRQKRISESGSQQLLLDAYTLKALLLQLHSLDATKASAGGKGGGNVNTSEKASAASSSSSSVAGSGGGRDVPSRTPAAPAMFVKLVTAKVGHIETVLKLVGTPEGTLVERFKIMWPDGTAADLQSLMQLKGMKKSDQQSLLEALGQHIHQQHQQQHQHQHPATSPHAPQSRAAHPPPPPPSLSSSSSSSSSQYTTAPSDAAAAASAASHPYSQSTAAASVLAAAAAGAGGDSRRDSGTAGSGSGSGSASDLRIAGVMGSGIAASASSYTAAGVKNLGDLSSTAAQNMKSIMGNLVNRR